jgi:hypothetical protein
MEIRETTLTKIQRDTGTSTLKRGSYIRVRVLKKLPNKNILVEFKGSRHLARITGSFTSKLFIARVQKLTPRLELKFIKDLEQKNKTFNTRFIEQILHAKKPFIQKLFESDNFLKALSVPVKVDKKLNKTSLQESISRQNIFKLTGAKKEIAEFYLLQNIHNLINADSFYFLLPLRVGDRNWPCELKLFGGKESQNHGFLLKIHLENERKIAFLVFIDYELINCSLSTNSRVLEDELKLRVNELINGLKSLKYDRTIQIRFVPYTNESFEHLEFLKKIDVEM